jgi:hypothetical protein
LNRRRTASKASALGRAEALFERITHDLAGEPGVSVGTGFGSNPGLRVRGKIFAMLSGDRLVVKLPQERVDELVDAGIGRRFDPRRDGRLMNEWVTVPIQPARQWRLLVGDAMRFVGR